MMSRGEWQSNCTSEEGEWLLEVERAGIGCRLYRLQGVPVPMTTRYTFSSGERGGASKADMGGPPAAGKKLQWQVEDASTARRKKTLKKRARRESERERE